MWSVRFSFVTSVCCDKTAEVVRFFTVKYSKAFRAQKSSFMTKFEGILSSNWVNYDGVIMNRDFCYLKELYLGKHVRAQEGTNYL